MKRIGKIVIVLILTLLGNAFVTSILDIETDPYYVLMIFIVVGSTVGIYDYQKKSMKLK